MKLTETLLLEGAADGGLIKGVKVLGASSRNKRRYTPEAMREAVALYEGAVVNVNHGNKQRPLDERFGKLKNVRYDAAKNELRGDLEHLTSHPAAGRLKEDLERGLNYFGLSHDADGQFIYQGGVKVVTKIDAVRSVDLVTNPATAISLLEQEDATAATDPNAGGPDPKVEALRAGITAVIDKGGDLTTVISGIEEFLSTFAENEPAEKKEEGAKTEGAQEQTVTLATVQRLIEQAISGKAPKKFVTAPENKTTKLTEQANNPNNPAPAAPKDKAALRKWLVG